MRRFGFISPGVLNVRRAAVSRGVSVINHAVRRVPDASQSRGVRRRSGAKVQEASVRQGSVAGSAGDAMERRLGKRLFPGRETPG